MFSQIIELDKQLFLSLNKGLSCSFLDAVMPVITHLGNGWVMAVILISAILIFSKNDFRKLFVTALIALVVGGLFVNVIKRSAGRKRPPAVFEEINVIGPAHKSRSFPPGHTQTAFGGAFFLYLMSRKRHGIIFFGFAVLTGFSRIYLGVHYPLDVFFGALAGMGFTYASWKLLRERPLP